MRPKGHHAESLPRMRLIRSPLRPGDRPNENGGEDNADQEQKTGAPATAEVPEAMKAKTAEAQERQCIY